MNKFRRTLNEFRAIAKKNEIAVYQDIEKKGDRVYRWIRIKDFWNHRPDLMRSIAEVAREVFGTEAVRLYHPKQAYSNSEYDGLAVSISLPPGAVKAYKT